MSFLVETTNINSTLMGFAKERKASIAQLDFDIVSVNTQIVNSKTGERELLVTEKLDISAEIWTCEDIYISQKYQINIKKMRKNIFCEPILSIGSDKFITKVAATLKKESKIIYDDTLASFLASEINKKKARLALLMGIFDEQMYIDIQALCEHIKVGGKLQEDFRIRIINCPAYRPSCDDSLVWHYLSKVQVKKEEDVKQKMMTVKSGIVSVTQGELLVEYKKPFMGIAGRSAKGEYLSVGEAFERNRPDFKTADSITVVQTEESVEYRAKNSGFVLLENGVLDVKKQLAIKEVTARTGSIDIGDSIDAIVDVQGENPDSDAIGDNVTVRAGEVKVSGSIGSGAKIFASNVVVGGQTHKSSYIEAKTAKIHKLKGSLQADEADIDVVEGGTVNAHTVRIGTLMGGEVRADKVFIDVLASNATVVASQLIEIQKPHGDSNRLYIEAAASREDRQKLQEIRSQIAALTGDFEEMDEELKEKVAQIEKNREFASTIKERIAAERKKNSPMANVLLAKYKHFAQDVHEEKELEANEAVIKEQLADKQRQLEQLQENTLGAKIVAKSRWKGSALVKFHLIYPATELTFIVEEGANIGELSLKPSGDGYKIEVQSAKN